MTPYKFMQLYPIKKFYSPFKETFSTGRLDMDTHQAIVQDCSRPMTVADMADGVDLQKVHLDLSNLSSIKNKKVALEDLEIFVDLFFEAIDKACGNDQQNDPSREIILREIANSLAEDDDLETQLTNSIEWVAESQARDETTEHTVRENVPSKTRSADRVSTHSLDNRSNNKPILDLSVLKK